MYGLFMQTPLTTLETILNSFSYFFAHKTYFEQWIVLTAQKRKTVFVLSDCLYFPRDWKRGKKRETGNVKSVPIGSYPNKYCPKKSHSPTMFPFLSLTILLGDDSDVGKHKIKCEVESARCSSVSVSLLLFVIKNYHAY